MSLRIAVLMTCYNRRVRTLECLGALNGQSVHNALVDVFLTDDGCSDGTADAVRAAFPDMHVLSGDGSLYWAGGMRLAWSAAMNVIDYDYYLWLNDDTVLYPKALHILTKTAEAVSPARDAIIIGSTMDPDGGRHSYGGYRFTGDWTLVLPKTRPQVCDAANGNIALVPRLVARHLGNLDKVFTHGMADFDYTLRASRAGFPVYVAPGYIGTCRGNLVEPWRDPSVPLFQRWSCLHSPKGLPPREYAIFLRRHCGRSWPLMILALYACVMMPGLWSATRNFRRRLTAQFLRTQQGVSSIANFPSLGSRRK
jgi:GT2 family glycosyltransferase